MSEGELWDSTRATTMVVTAQYSHDHQGWAAKYVVLFQGPEDGLTKLGSASIEFGPFDSYIEVGYWLSSLSKVLKGMTSEPIRLAPPDPPQGNDSAPASRPGR